MDLDRIVCIKGLPDDVSESEIATLFSCSGDIESILMQIDSHTGYISDTAYIVFTELASASAAMTQAFTQLRGKKLCVEQAQDNHKDDIIKLYSKHVLQPPKQIISPTPKPEDKIPLIGGKENVLKPEGVPQEQVLEQLASKIADLDITDFDNLMTRIHAHRQTEIKQSSVMNENFSSVKMPSYNIHVPKLPPKLPLFSGTSKDIAYTQWRYNVESLIRPNTPYSEQNVLDVIRQSLRGRAADVLTSLGVAVSVIDVLQKFDCLFGGVSPENTLIQSYFSAKQQKDEDVVGWGCRIQKLLSQLILSPHYITCKSLSRSVFWNGLFDKRIKDGLRYLFTQGHDYDRLLVEARVIEEEESKSNQPKSNVRPVAHQIQVPRDSTSTKPMQSKTIDENKVIGNKLDQLMEMMKSYEARLERVEKKVTQPLRKQKNDQSNEKKKETCTRCRRNNHTVDRCHATRDVDGKFLQKN